MKKNYKLEGLECANCAAKMEKKISSLSGVLDVSINFLTAKMALEYDESKNIEDIIAEATKAANKIERGISIKEI